MKKILSLMLALLLLVSATSLVGCGGEGASTTGTDDTKAPADTQAPAPKDEVAEALISKIGGASETFVGALSEETYASAQEAAKAYVELEVVGKKKADILNTKSNGTLSDSEIKEAGIPDSLLANADSVEELEITYGVIDATMDGGISLLTDTLNTEKTVKVYVIKCGVNWQYFTPRPVTGNTITKTYYDSVFNSAKYKNCTFKATQVTRSETKYSGGGESGEEITEVTTEQILKIAGNKIYMESKNSAVAPAVSATPTVQVIYAYMEEVDGEITCYVKTSENGEWMRGSMTALGFTSLEELAPFHDQYLDYTYFTKTDYGFELGKDNMLSFMKETLGEELVMLLDQGVVFDMLCKYVVQDGVLSAMISDAKIGMSMSQDGYSASVDYAIKGEMTCTDYGTTVVEKPFTE